MQFLPPSNGSLLPIAAISMAAKFNLKTHLPFQSHFALIDGHRMHYIDEGSGPVVVLLHGNPTWCFYYRNLIRELRTHFRVIAPDHIGLGLSDHPVDAHFRAIDRVHHLAQLLKQLSIEKCSLVMHDWGGPIGTGFAVRNIPMIEKLVYLNTTLTETESLPLVIKTAATPILGKWITKSSKRFLKLTTSWGVVKKLPREIRDGYHYPYASAARRSALWDFVADIPFEPSHPSYSEMIVMADKLPELAHVPVQIIWGLRDLCFHREMLNKVAQHFPQARIREIPEASHLVLEDAPDICINIIRPFLLEAAEQKPVQATAGLNQNAFVAALRQLAEKSPHQDAVIDPQFFPDTVRYIHHNFRELGFLINKYERGLSGQGLRAGDRVLMLVPPGVDFLALSYAVMARGAIPVFVDPGMGKENLFRCIQDSEPNFFIGSPKAHLLRYLKPSLFKHLRASVCVSDWLGLGTVTTGTLKKYSAQPLPPVSAPEVALIAFTSGGTGVPKGVLFTQTMVREQLRIFKDVFGLQAPAKDVPLLPIFSLFGLACGVCTVFPPIDTARPLAVNPERIVRIIQDLGVSTSFGSPTLWLKIAEYCVRTRTTLSSLQRVFMAGASVPKQTLQRVADVMPQGEVFTPYGATEALPVTLVSGKELCSLKFESARTGEQGTFVGAPVAGVKLKVIEAIDAGIQDLAQVRELPAYEIGEVIVSGGNVSRSYLNRPEANASAKIQDGTSHWHRLGDVGYLDAQGRLYFCGRKTHVVRMPERNYCSDPVELLFNEHAKVKRSALVAYSKNGAVEPAVVIEPLPQFWPESNESKEILRRELQAVAKASPLTQSIEKIFFHPSFPVDARHNAKIFRDKLGELVSQGKLE